MINVQFINDAKNQYKKFISLMKADDFCYKLTGHSEITPYARCFAIFGMKLLQSEKDLADFSDLIASKIRHDLYSFKKSKIDASVNIKYDKPYLQLLTFSLSALYILGRLEDDPLEEHVLPILSQDIAADLEYVGAFEGRPQSGNQAMFMAILLCHANLFLSKDTSNAVALWKNLHINAMNRFGFWGNTVSMTHLQFQNGYHQYEILDYLQEDKAAWKRAARNTLSLMDYEGHFAPYPGGGGCYDYDAIYLITEALSREPFHSKKILENTVLTILNEQNADGGFCESHKVRPRNISNMINCLRHILSAPSGVRFERLKWSLALLRSKHNRVHTHWSHYSRMWSESDLWDSWFRMLAIARIDVLLNPDRQTEWGFINYPGIGYHSSLMPALKL